jgi:ribosomal protein S18 acetylase RimI-like enzyme
MSENVVKIRVAERGDAAALVEFNQAMALETEGKTLDPAKISAGVDAVFEDDKKGFYVVAESANGIVGGLMVTYEWSDWRNGWFWWIQSVYILPEGRGQGLYSRMYEFVQQKAAEQGNVCGFRLYVEHGNLHAQKVYEKLGMNSSHYLMYESEPPA